MFLQQWALWVKPRPIMDVRRQSTSHPPWRHCIWSPVSGGGSGGGCTDGMVVLRVRTGCGGAQGSCWRGDAEDPWVLVALGRRAWFGGDPGVGVALVMLSMWFLW
jgi:hypothetical protein